MPRRVKSLLVALLTFVVGSSIVGALIQANVQELARGWGWDQLAGEVLGPRRDGPY